MTRFDEDTNRHFRITEERGEILLCNSRGVLIKPFDPNLTGKFDFAKRLKIMQQAEPTEPEHVEYPKSLKSNYKRNYSPQIQLLEGYAQMPRQYNAPYGNDKLSLKQDINKRRRSQHTVKFFEESAKIIRDS